MIKRGVTQQNKAVLTAARIDSNNMFLMRAVILRSMDPFDCVHDAARYETANVQNVTMLVKNEVSGALARISWARII